MTILYSLARRSTEGVAFGFQLGGCFKEVGTGKLHIADDGQEEIPLGGGAPGTRHDGDELGWKCCL